MGFRISGLPARLFAPLFALTQQELAARHIVRMHVDRHPGFPCRVSLEDAHPGESVLLLNFEHLAVASPYRSAHAIFVRQDAREAQLDVDEVPASLRQRLLSLRAFDVRGMMIDCDVLPGAELEKGIGRLLRGDAAYLHVHNAKPGCYAARVDLA
jgi:Protein of unknown function (DUF1203)